jgi:ArsR family transcriptional regulator
MNSDARNYQDQLYIQLSKVGKAICSPKRLELLDLLAQGEKTVDALSREASMSLANTSQHLQNLLESGLVKYRKQGLYSYYQLKDQSVSVFLSSLQTLADQHISELRRLREEFQHERNHLESIHLQELIKRMKKGHVTLIDVRPREEYDVLHIPGANSIPLEELEKYVATLPVNQEIVAYCRGRHCVLSMEAVDLLRLHGFQAYRLEESAQDWLVASNHA